MPDEDRFATRRGGGPFADLMSESRPRDRSPGRGRREFIAFFPPWVILTVLCFLYWYPLDGHQFPLWIAVLQCGGAALILMTLPPGWIVIALWTFTVGVRIMQATDPKP